MAKVNMFKADRALSIRVSEFMEFHMSRITDSKRHNQIVAGINATIKGLNNALGSALDKDETKAAIDAQLNLLEKENARYKKACDDKAKWVWSVEDVTVYDAVKADKDVNEAICDWLNAWGLEVSGNENLVCDIIKNIGGKRFATSRAIVNSGAKTWTAARTKVDVLKVVYATVAEYMVSAGTLKPVQIPEDIREAFAPKSKKSAK